MTLTIISVITPSSDPGLLLIYVDDNTIYVGQTVKVTVNTRDECVANAAIYINEVLIDYTDNSGELEFTMPETEGGLLTLRAVKGTSNNMILVFVIDSVSDSQTTSTILNDVTTTTVPGFVLPVAILTIYILNAQIQKTRKR